MLQILIFIAETLLSLNWAIVTDILMVINLCQFDNICFVAVSDLC